MSEGGSWTRRTSQRTRSGKWADWNFLPVGSSRMAPHLTSTVIRSPSGLWSRRLNARRAGGEGPRVEIDRVSNYALGIGAPAKAIDLHGLLLEHLVVQEESFELAQSMWRQLTDVRVVLVLRIVDVHGDDLVILALLVAHREHADRARAQDTERQHRLLTEYQHVERVAVVAVRLWQEAVIRRVVHGGVEDAIDREQPRALVELVLHLGAFRNLDHGPKVPRDVIAEPDVVPGIHRSRMILSGAIPRRATEGLGGSRRVPQSNGRSGILVRQGCHRRT